MEKAEREFIRENKPKLIELTDCNVMFLAIMEQEKLLSPIDKEEIDEMKGRMKRANKFYEIIIQRSDSFERLKKAMEKTNQTGALNLLNQFTS